MKRKIIYEFFFHLTQQFIRIHFFKTLQQTTFRPTRRAECALKQDLAYVVEVSKTEPQPVPG